MRARLLLVSVARSAGGRQAPQTQRLGLRTALGCQVVDGQVLDGEAGARIDADQRSRRGAGVDVAVVGAGDDRASAAGAQQLDVVLAGEVDDLEVGAGGDGNGR